MKVDELQCDKKSYFLGLKSYMACNVSSPDRPDDDPLYLPDVENVDIDPDVVVDEVDISTYGTHFEFDEATTCRITDEGEEIWCSVPEKRY